MKDDTILRGQAHQDTIHDSAIKHVTGRADYTDDLAEPYGLLHAYLGSVSDSLPVEELTQHLNEALHIAEINNLVDVKVKALLEMGGLAVFRTDRPLDTLNYARQAARAVRRTPRSAPRRASSPRVRAAGR